MRSRLAASGFLKGVFRDPFRVPRISENYHRVPTGPYRVPQFP